jgi:hypothetical protein
MVDTDGNFLGAAVAPDGYALIAWEHNNHLRVQRLDRAGTPVAYEAVSCTAPATGRVTPLGIGPDGRGVLAIGHEPWLVYAPGWNIVREGGDEFGPPQPGCRGGPYPLVTPNPPIAGPIRIDMRGVTDLTYGANWWKMDTDLDGTFETLSHTGVVDVVWDEGNHGVAVEHCYGPRYDEDAPLCALWGTPFPIYVGRLYPFTPPALAPVPIQVEIPRRADLGRVLRRGLPVRVKALRAANVRIGLHSAKQRVGRRTTALRAGTRRRLAVRVRRSFARRARRARKVTMRVRVAAGDVTISRRVLLRHRGR